MEYKISKEELGNDWLYSTLIALDKCMAAHGLPLYVVGARARDVAMKLMKGDRITGFFDLKVQRTVPGSYILHQKGNL